MTAPNIQLRIKSRLVGLSFDNDLLVRNTLTDSLEYVPTSLEINKIVKLTQAAYDALEPPDESTIYIVVG